MKSRLEVDERRELPSAICSENGPFDVTHRHNFWRSANVRGQLAGWLVAGGWQTPSKRIPRPLHPKKILVERNLPRLCLNSRVFSTSVLINSSSRSTIDRLARWIINELAPLHPYVLGKQSVVRRKGNLPTYYMKGSIEIDEPLRTTGLPAFASGCPFSAYEIRWTGAKTSNGVESLSVVLSQWKSRASSLLPLLLLSPS